MPETRVYLAQCLCPARHCILAAAGEYASAFAAQVLTRDLRQAILALLRSETINPWCDLCQSEDWHYEVGRTPYRTMEEATPHLHATERANWVTARRLRPDRR